MNILRRRSLRGRLPPLLVSGAIVALALVLLALALMVIRGFEESRALRAEVIRSHETRSGLQHVLSLHQDLETAQRGFQLTGDETFLIPHIAAERKLDVTFERLERGLLSGSRLTGSLVVLQQLSLEKREFVDEVIALVRDGEDERAQNLVIDGEGMRLMDALRTEIARIDAEERAQLIDHTRRSDAATRRLQRMNIGMNTALFLTIAAAVFFAMRSYAEGTETLRRLADLSRRQEAIYESATDGMLLLNSTGDIETVNPAVCRMSGYEEVDLVGREIGMLFEEPPDRERVENFLRHLGARSSDEPFRTQEFMAERKDGTTFPIEVSVSPVHLADRTIFLAIIRNVTDRKHVEQMKNEFVSTVSHELRTPLTSIAGSLGLITGGAAGEIPERALRLVEIARTNCTRLVRLINDILDIEKIESGKMRFDVKPVPLGPFLERALQENRSYAEEMGVEIVLAPVFSDAIVLADEDRLMQVMTNLLSNAAKFSPSGETVQVTVRALDRRYRINIADKGPGIADEFREKIFGKFAQADSSITRQKGGTGLGLSIVREIVTRLHGSVSFDSEAGKGTVFHVDLPAAPRPEPEPEWIDKPATDSSGPGLQILHVDDDTDMLRVVSSAFEGKAHVHSTPSLVEAKSAIRHSTFHAVILDIGMQEGSGLELVPLVRRNPLYTPIVVFTAQDVPIDSSHDVEAVMVKSRASLDTLVEDVIQRATAAADDRKGS